MNEFFFISNEENVLFYSIRNIDKELSMKLITQYHVPINQMNLDNVTPLHLAIQTNDPEFVKLMLDNGANPNVPENPCIVVAKDKNNKDIIKLLEQFGATENDRIIFTEPPELPTTVTKPYVPFTPLDNLFQIIAMRNVTGLKLFCHDFKDYEQIDEKRYFPLHYAVEKGFLDIVTILFERGADIDFNHHETAMMCAVKNKNKEITEFFVRNQADISAHNDHGENVLFYSVRNDDLEMTEYLISKRAQLNLVNDKNETPLSLAITRKNIPMIELLLSKGADPNIAGVSCLKLALDTKDSRIISLLETHGGKEEARKSHISRKNQGRNDVRKQKIEQRSPKSNIVRNGTCMRCGTNENMLKLVPCGHAVICKACLNKLPELCHQCPICTLTYMATTNA